MSDIRNIVILTGAGIFAEFGIATFRGPGSLWRTAQSHRAHIRKLQDRPRHHDQSANNFLGMVHIATARYRLKFVYAA